MTTLSLEDQLDKRKQVSFGAEFVLLHQTSVSSLDIEIALNHTTKGAPVPQSTN
jgi:hypothetical protein